MTSIIHRLFLFSLATVFGAAALAASAQAAFDKTIVDEGGAEIGSISFPAATGSSVVDVTFFLGAFAQEDITSISWQLDATGAVMSLDLEALQGDDLCPPTPIANCSNQRLFMSQDAFRIDPTECSGWGPGSVGTCMGLMTIPDAIDFVDATPAYSCEGFKGPLAKGPVAIKRKRLSWLRATLRDQDGKRLRRGDLDAAPLLEVTFEPPAEAAAARLAWPGIGADGTAFVPIGNRWHLLLTLEDFADPGNYTVRMVSGDPAAYRVDPTCEGVFVR